MSPQSATNSLVHAQNEKHFLGLPGEIVNKIYNYALVEEGPISIPHTGIFPPGLLSVCRQIHKEASSVYYTENVFHARIENYNGAAFVPFSAIVDKYRGSSPRPCIESVTTLPGPHWKNLMMWIKACRSDLMAGPGYMEDNLGTGTDVAVMTMFKTVRDGMLHLTWGEVETILTAMRPMLVMQDDRWSIDW